MNYRATRTEFGRKRTWGDVSRAEREKRRTERMGQHCLTIGNPGKGLSVPNKMEKTPKGVEKKKKARGHARGGVRRGSTQKEGRTQTWDFRTETHAFAEINRRGAQEGIGFVVGQVEDASAVARKRMGTGEGARPLFDLSNPCSREIGKSRNLRICPNSSPVKMDRRKGKPFLQTSNMRAVEGWNWAREVVVMKWKRRRSPPAVLRQKQCCFRWHQCQFWGGLGRGGQKREKTC